MPLPPRPWLTSAPLPPKNPQGLRLAALLLAPLLAWLLSLHAPRPALAFDPPAYQGLSPAEANELWTDLASLQQRLEPLQAAAHSAAEQDRVADAAVFLKGLEWALTYDRAFTPADVSLLKQAVAKTRERLAPLEQGELPWAGQTGKLIRGFRSAIDGSLQPYGLVIPATLPERQPYRLDVVLHGSTRPVGLSELKFCARFPESPPGTPPPTPFAEEPFLELHPLGRVENGYRFAGETDVFEAIEAVCRQYPIDRDRIVLRGMSMGASGTWHLGLKNPDRFVALGPYCGYVDTRRFSETPLENFIKVGDLPEHQELALHLLDSQDYAANGGVVPAIACMGAKDIFFDAHVLMGQAYRREGLQLVNLISPETAHTIDPITQREQLRLIAAFAERGLDRHPRQLRFATWTLKYPRCHWVELRALGAHYQKADFEARRLPDGQIQLLRATNVVRFALRREVLEGETPRLRVGELDLDLRAAPPGDWIEFENVEGKWQLAGAGEWRGKRPGLTGPIDDAFTAPFLCVRGTGTPWNPEVHAWSLGVLQRFAAEWHQYFRGDLPIVDDVALTPAQMAKHHLVLFGDPGSNQVLARALPGLPIKWTAAELQMAGEKYPAGSHAPALIVPNPLLDRGDKYLVLNTGHSFHATELGTLNYLLFPRLGDWSVMRVGRGPELPTGALPVQGDLWEEPLVSGYFNERWQFPEPKPAE